MSDIIRIPNIDKYTIEFINNELIITQKLNYLSEEQLKKTSLTNSEIIECNIVDSNNIKITNNKKYRSILIDLWKSIATQKILQNTTFNMKLTNENGINGYNWCPEINMSIQYKDSNGSMIEIIKMIEINKYNIDICIKLQDGKIIYYKN